MFALVRWYAELVTQQCRLKVKVIIEGHQLEVWILRLLHCHSAAGDIAVLQTALLDFGDLDPIFKVTGGLRLLENVFSAPYLQNEWMDFDQTCTSILLRQGQELIRFWWPWPHFQGHGASYCWKMACLHPISRMNGWILTKLVHLYCGMEKNWLDFSDYGPIFKVTGGLRLLKNGLSAPCLMKEWMNFDQTCTTILLWHEKKLIDLNPIFKVTGGLRLLELYLQNEWMDFDQTCTAILLRQGQKTD